MPIIDSASVAVAATFCSWNIKIQLSTSHRWAFGVVPVRVVCSSIGPSPATKQDKQRRAGQQTSSWPSTTAQQHLRRTQAIRCRQCPGCCRPRRRVVVPCCALAALYQFSSGSSFASKRKRRKENAIYTRSQTNQPTDTDTDYILFALLQSTNKRVDQKGKNQKTSNWIVETSLIKNSRTVKMQATIHFSLPNCSSVRTRAFCLFAWDVFATLDSTISLRHFASSVPKQRQPHQIISP